MMFYSLMVSGLHVLKLHNLNQGLHLGNKKIGLFLDEKVMGHECFTVMGTWFVDIF